MINAFCNCFQSVADAASPWLKCVAALCFLAWLAMLLWEYGAASEDVAKFKALSPFKKLSVVAVLCMFTLLGGTKEGGDRGGVSGGLRRSSGDSQQLRTLPPELEATSNLLAVTAFEVSHSNCTVSFETAWATNLFDYTDSRNLYLFSSTNLIERKWTPLCMIPMPENTNVHSFVVAQSDVMLSMRPWFLDSFGGAGFYRFGVDFDSDGDGIADDVERLWTLTDPEKFDTDGDGLSDGQELSYQVNTNPLAYDTDGDGVGDGDEIAAGSNPRSENSDQDELTDAQELGTMTALTEDNFMWFDMSEGTDLLAGYSTVNSSSWVIPLVSEIVVNNVCYTNVRVCVDGTAYLLCPTNVMTGGYSYYNSNLSNAQWSASHLTVAVCGANLYARTSDWDSKILYGSLISEGRAFDVVEYRNMGLYDHNDTNELITCQLILPHDETNTIYVSYLCASNTFRDVSFAAGIQCGWIPSNKSGERFYNLSWPIVGDFPQDGLTIKYSIGACTDPTKTDTDDDGLSDSDETLLYNTNPLVADTDGDGIPDGIEVSLGSDPRSADTDADGMPDGWEVYYGLNPLVGDSSLDADNDGLANRAEYESGINPVEADTDEDGIGDRDELGWWEYSSPLPAFSYSNVTNLISSSSGYDDDMFLVNLPFEVRFAGYRATKAKVSVNGFVWLVTDVGEVPTSSDYGNQNLSYNTRSQYHGFVAAYWDDLYANSGRNAQLSVSDAYANGQRYCVIKYQNISIRGDASNMGTFRVVIPENETNTVYVAYDSLASGFNGAGATIGAQSPNMGCNFLVAYNESGAVTNGMTIAYHFGTGSNPLMTDSDGDGLEDGVEMSIGTSPCCSDTDNDGLDDEWEHVNGLDPLSDTGNEGADGDMDEDGLCNLMEYKIGTNPVVVDTDGDGAIDSAETGVLDASGTMAWVSLPVDAVDVTSRFSNADGSLIDYELTAPVSVNGEKLSTVVIDVNGIVYLPRSGHEGDFRVISGANLEYAICTNALVLAPYLDNLYLTANEPVPKVSVAETSVGTEQVLVVQYENVCPYSNRSRTSTTNALSFQVVVSLNGGNVHFLYKDIVGSDMNGRNADIGVQMLGGRWAHVYTYSQQDRVKGNGNPMRAFFTQGLLYNGLDLAFDIGAGSSPLSFDTDGDGINDGVEIVLGISPITSDTDGDELPDSWEVLNNLNPASTTGGDGASGDPDNDGVDNFGEYGLGTNPHLADTDSDGLSDGMEAVCVSFAEPLPWLAITVLTNMTETITNISGRVVSWNLPSAIQVQRETITNITINARGVVCLNRVGYDHPNSSHSPYNLLTQSVDTNAFVVVAYGGYLNLYDLDQASDVKIGTAEYNGRGYIVVEYDNMYYEYPSSSTNLISFQVALPTGQADRISVNYADVVGTYMDGRNAIIGCQSFGADDRVSYCRYEQGRIHDGLSISFLVGYGSNPIIADTDYDGISDGVEVNTYGSNPRSTDTDADGLADAQEIALGTSLNNSDSDGDSLLDGWEVANNLNPLSAIGNDGAVGDIDNDTLTNLQEQNAGSNPRSADTDNDGLSDPEEVVAGTDLTFPDTDHDGLNDGLEDSLGTNPLQPDSDSDGMNDGWEYRYGFNPVVNNATDNNPTNDIGEDPDEDGLTNGQECNFGTNPLSSDSDGDGVSDGVEVEQNSDPTDSTDGGLPNSRLATPFTFGDPSGSHSEKYTLEITPVSGDGATPSSFSWLNENYGQCETKIAMLKPGWKYEVRLRHAGTNGSGSSYPDYDYELDFAGNDTTYGVIKDDPESLFGSDYTSTSFAGAGKVAYIYALAPPKLIPDYDRSGAIDDSDKTKSEQNNILHFWINNDKDGDSTDGKYAESTSIDMPGATTSFWFFDISDSDLDDGNVNGYRDLIDFTPVFMDVSTIQILPESIRNSLTFKLSQDSEAVNVVWTGLTKATVGLFQTGDVEVCGRELNEASYGAGVEQVSSGGITVPDAFATQMKTASSNKGVVFIEGRKATSSPLKLDVYYNGQKVATGELPLHLSSVEDMYRWLNSRGLSGEGVDFPSRLGNPDNRPDNETSDKHLVFVHGANVTQKGARGWAAEIFKRMWQSGMTAKFTAVTWRSDKGADWNYQENVSNAFFTASAIAQQIKDLPGTKVLMAHSLGNMVCSSMIQDHELVPDCYLMCNSAVPAEAYDTDQFLRVPQLVHPEWVEYPTNSWASSWHWLFRNELNDDRGLLGWPGRFSNVAQYAFNFYSTGDEVLELANNNNVHSWTGVSDSWGHYAWHKQELFKGRGGIGGTDWAGWNIEENWLGVDKISVAEAQAMTEADFRTNTVFLCYPSSMNSTNISLLVRGAHLAQGIPALTPAAGRVAFGGEPMKQKSFNCHVQIDRPNAWPERSDYQGQWCHSDMKDVAYFYVYKFYDKVIEKGNLK